MQPQDPLRLYSLADPTTLTSEAAGDQAAALVLRCGARRMALMPAARAERLAFAAVWHVARHHRSAWREHPAEAPPAAVEALPVVKLVQDWATATGLSPFTASLSRNCEEALARYEVASLCDRVSEDFGDSDPAYTACWYQAAFREAYRAIMWMPNILAGVDQFPEEMIRVAAAAHIARIGREHDAIRTFGRQEVDGLPGVEVAVRQASRLAIEHQKARNRLLTQASR